MFPRFLKSVIRSLAKSRAYSILNIFGLAIGIACAGLIFLWVEDEMKFDRNNLKRDRIFLVRTNDKVDGGIFSHSSTPGPLAESMQAKFPAVINSCRITESSPAVLFKSGTKSIYAKGEYADPAVFDMFTLPFLEGSQATAFKQLNSLVITKMARTKLFGDGVNAIGKTLMMDNRQAYVITGVLQDLPENSTLQFEWLAPFNVWLHQNEWALKWNNFGLSTYLELSPTADVQAMNEQLLNPRYDFTTQKIEPDKSSVHLFLFGMNDWHLRNDFENGKQTGRGKIQFVHLFTIIAWIILFIACINFMNLATAGSEKRAKEIGVRKVLGAGRSTLIFQFMGEAICLTILAGIVAILLMLLLLPAFNLVVQKDLSLGVDNPGHLIALLLLILICGMVAGSYPSLYLSLFRPAFVLKGMKLKSGSAAFIRKSLVVMQFAVSITLIIGTVLINQQINHVKSRDLGYNKNKLIQVSAEGNIENNFSLLRQDLISTGVVVNAALADHETISAGNNTTSIQWEGKEPNSQVVISQRLVSKEFFSTTGMHLIAGRDFEVPDELVIPINRRQDSVQLVNVIVTASMEKLLGKGSAVGKTMRRNGNSGTVQMTVTGVIKDYVYGNMYGESAPVVFYCVPQHTSLLYVRMKPDIDPTLALAKIGTVMRQDNPAYPFEYQFVDEQFDNMFLSETLISRLSGIFSMLAIVISCLGLFGLAAYTAEQRTKEIGVRKVLGASISGIARLVSVDFLKLVSLSCLLAFPVAWWLMNNWLINYQYRINISWWIFIASGAVAILIALLTVSFHAIRAAMANPVKSLRTN